MVWSPDPREQEIALFGQRHASSEAAALLDWAVSAVNTLHYLADVDASLQTLGHHPDTLDIAHLRWAFGTCITAFDLCAGAFGRAFCGNTDEQDFDLTYFDPLPSGRRAKAITERRALLPPKVLDWIDRAWPQYVEVKTVRDKLTHRRVPRHLFTNGRLQIDVGGSRREVPDLVIYAQDVATRHVRELMALLPAL